MFTRTCTYVCVLVELSVYLFFFFVVQSSDNSTCTARVILKLLADEGVQPKQCMEAVEKQWAFHCKPVLTGPRLIKESPKSAACI